MGVLLLASLALSLTAATAAEAQQGSSAGFQPPVVTVPETLPGTPSDFSVDASRAINAANEYPRVEALRRDLGELSAIPKASRGTWEISYIDGDDAVALVFVDGNDAEVEEFWTESQVDWPMARGYSGQFGHILNAPYVWIPLALVFFLGLFDWRRPKRIAHLDLLVLLSFALSQALFDAAEIGPGVLLAYPPLLYLFARLAWIGFKGGGPGLAPSAPTALLAVGLVALCGLRIAANTVDSGVIDVGYAGVVGADRITHGEPLYGEGAFPEDNPHGDTYGPANYLSYVPFELAFPWSGSWDELHAAHAAAIFFDLAALIGLFVLGLRLRRGRAGRRLGVILAFAWAAYPYTAYALQSNSNDSLVGALLIWSLVALSSPAVRGFLVGVAVAVKFTPIVLVPLLAGGREGVPLRLERSGRRRIRLPRGLALSRRRALSLIAFGSILIATLSLLFVLPANDPGLAVTWERTIGSQVGRVSPFSVWGQLEALAPLQLLAIAAVLGFSLVLAFAPAKRTAVQVAALAGASIIGVQLTLDHWFYLYIPWFLGLSLVALAAGGEVSVTHESPSRGRSSRRRPHIANSGLKRRRALRDAVHA